MKIKLQMLFFVIFVVFSAGVFSNDDHHEGHHDQHHHRNYDDYWGGHHWHGNPLDSFLHGFGHQLAIPNLGRYYAPLSQYYLPRSYCYPVDVGGYYDYYGQYIPNIQQQCDYH
jgi:hypothetical protein